MVDCEIFCGFLFASVPSNFILFLPLPLLVEFLIRAPFKRMEKLCSERYA